MPTENYQVNAGFNFKAPQAVRALGTISSRISAMGRQLQSTRTVAGGLVTKLVAVGGAYLGIRALTNATRSFSRSIFQASGNAEDMQTALAAVLSGVEKITFAQGIQEAGQLYGIIEDLAVTSPATGAELFQVFQGIVGPIRAAGSSMQDVLTLTKNSVATATALGVDFQQAQRDISIMARGLAGVDVKTFSILQSMGLITETTEQWNQMAPDKRAKRLMEVMGKMGGEAAEAYARTWTGLSSTFRGIMDRFRRVFGTALFERLKGTLERVNNFLLKYRANMEAVLTMLGQRLAGIFDGISQRLEATFADGGAGLASVADRMDGVLARMAELWARFQELKPILVEAAKVFLAIQVAQIVLGPLLTAVGAIGTAVSSIGGLLGAAGSVGGAAAGVGAAAAGAQLALPFAAAGGAAAGGGGILASIMPVLSSLGSALASILVPVLAVGAAIAAIVLAFKEYGDGLRAFMAPLLDSFSSIGKQLLEIGGHLWQFVRPILAFVGGAVVVALTAIFRILAFVLDKIVLPPLRILARVLAWVGEKILKPIFDALAFAFGKLYDAIVAVVEFVRSKIDKASEAGLFGGAAQVVAEARRRAEQADAARGKRRVAGMTLESAPAGPVRTLFDDIRQAWESAQGPQGAVKTGVPDVRAGTVVDMRGSKISVKQEFREADPDRVFVQMRDALEREAVSRTQSGFANAFSR